jgi:hypothetical protein
LRWRRRRWSDWRGRRRRGIVESWGWWCYWGRKARE